MTRAGQLRWRLRIERPSPADHDAAGDIITWVDVGGVWANAEPFGSDRNDGVARSAWRLRVRAGPTIKPGWRLRFGARHFLVSSVVGDDGSGLIVLDCAEIQT